MHIKIHVVEERRCASCDVQVRDRSKMYRLDEEVVVLCRKCEDALNRKKGRKKEVGA